MKATYRQIPLDEEGCAFAMREAVVAHRGPGMTLEMVAASFAENLRGGENYKWGHGFFDAYSEDAAAAIKTALDAT